MEIYEITYFQERESKVKAPLRVLLADHDGEYWPVTIRILEKDSPAPYQGMTFHLTEAGFIHLKNTMQNAFKEYERKRKHGKEAS